MKRSRKKQLILSVLILALSAAVYLNWQFAKSGGTLDIGDSVWTGGSYGEAEFVSKPEPQQGKAEEKDSKDSEEAAKQKKGFFAEAKTRRTKSRDEALDALQKSLKDASVTAEEKKNLTDSLSYLVSSIEKESKIEALVRAKGIKDCIIYIDNEKCDAVISGENTDGEIINQIKEIIVRESGLSAENISIVETK